MVASVRRQVSSSTATNSRRPPSNMKQGSQTAYRVICLGRYCSDHGMALSTLRFCRRRHRGSDRHGWRFSDDAVADTTFWRPSAHGGGNRLALRRRNENGCPQLVEADKWWRTCMVIILSFWTD